MYEGHQATLMRAPDWHNHLEPCSPEPQPAAGHRSTALVPGPESIATARDFTTATLHGWRLDMLIRDAVMVASELVTNAIRYGTRCAGTSRRLGAPQEIAAPHVGLAWYRQATRLVCIVTDWNTKPPQLMPAGPYAESGRGLQIVHSVATAWGWTLLNAEEKAVWAAFRLPGAEPTALTRRAA
jgi:hypothetical protein